MKILLYIFLFITVSIICACYNRNTDQAYLYKTVISNEEYLDCKNSMLDTIKNFIKRKSGPYYPNEYDTLTQVFIDTILLDSTRNKMAFFVITKNTNDKLLTKGRIDEFHYDAHCFVAIKRNKLSWNIKWFSNGGSLQGFQSIKTTSEDIRDLYFNQLNQIGNGNGGSQYKYNFNDRRFWDGPIWNMLF